MALGKLLPALIATLVLFGVLIAIVYLWYTERIPEYYVAAPISIIGFFGLAGIAMYPESTGGAWFFTLMAFGGAWVAYRDYTGSGNWGPTQIVGKEEGLMLGYQDNTSSGEKRWAVIVDSDGKNYCVDSDGHIREENYFFDDKSSAVAAARKSTDPLNDVELVESKSKKAKRIGSKGFKFSKLTAYVVVGAIVGFVMVAYLSGAVTQLRSPDPRVVTPSQPSPNTFEVTVQNSGGSGGVEVSLYWIPESQSYPEGNYPDNPEEAGFELHSTRTVQFNSGERRAVSFNAQMPDGYDKYYFRVDDLTE
jgi:hypothetical protein